jgi:hypothetical protein
MKSKKITSYLQVTVISIITSLFFALFLVFNFFDSRDDKNVIQNIRNFTLLLKNDIEFKKLGKKE